MVTRKIFVIEDKGREPVTSGYGSSGESLWSRGAARGRHVDTKPTRERMSLSRLDIMVEHERKQVAKLEARAVAARGSGAHYTALCSKLQRLRFFLRKLEAEQRELAP